MVIRQENSALNKYLFSLPVSTILMLSLSGCISIPDKMNNQLPDIALPKQWDDANTTKTTPIDSDWWKYFGSDELTDLVNESARNNLDIAVAITHIQQSEAQANIAGVPLSPNVNLAVTAGRDVPLSSGVGTTTASGLLQMSYETDFFGKNKANWNAALSSLKASIYDHETVSLTVTSNVVATYLQILSFKDRIGIAQQNIANAERVLHLVEVQSRAGSASTLDLARQRAALARQKASIPELEQQEHDAEVSLALLLGRIPQTLKIQGDGLSHIVMPVITPGLPSDLLIRRPDIRRQEARLEAADANIEAARAAFFPSITLTSYVGAQSNALMSLFDGPNLLANITSSIIAPIFDGGALKGQHQLMVAQQEELVSVYRSTVLTAFSEVENALENIRSLDAQYQLKQTEVEEAKTAFSLSEIRYRVGVEDLMTVLDTQSNLSNAQNELGLLKFQRLQAAVSLYKALGGGWIDEGRLEDSIRPHPEEKNAEEQNSAEH